jgi:hypothetical protein
MSQDLPLRHYSKNSALFPFIYSKPLLRRLLGKGNWKAFTLDSDAYNLGLLQGWLDIGAMVKALL